VPFVEWGIVFLVLSLGVSLVLAAVLLLLPAAFARGGTREGGTIPVAGYFTALGLAYMLVETHLPQGRHPRPRRCHPRRRAGDRELFLFLRDRERRLRTMGIGAGDAAGFRGHCGLRRGRIVVLSAGAGSLLARGWRCARPRSSRRSPLRRS